MQFQYLNESICLTRETLLGRAVKLMLYPLTLNFQISYGKNINPQSCRTIVSCGIFL